jgi:hypothetical protein
VIDEATVTGDEARVSKTSVCGGWGAVAGTLRYFADKFGVPRAAIEGTQLPGDLVRRNATRHPPRIVYDPAKRDRPLALERRVTYFGFDLDREREPLSEFPPDLVGEVRHALAESLARGEARHQAVPRNRPLVEEIREVWRRSGGTTSRLNQADLTAWYESQLADVNDMQEFRNASLRLDVGALVPADVRARWMRLPGAVEIRDRTVPMHYEVEEAPDGTVHGVVRLQMPEKLARTIVAEELPELDRPLRFAVTRGARGTVRADSLEDVQEQLSRPWMEDERPGRKERPGRGVRPPSGPRKGKRRRR